jgi:hypothetical protein
MDNDHNLIITPKGQYTYDPDHDCYTRVHSHQDFSHWSRFGWLYIILALTLMLATVELA